MLRSTRPCLSGDIEPGLRTAAETTGSSEAKKLRKTMEGIAADFKKVPYLVRRLKFMIGDWCDHYVKMPHMLLLKFKKCFSKYLNI